MIRARSDAIRFAAATPAIAQLSPAISAAVAETTENQRIQQKEVRYRALKSTPF